MSNTDVAVMAREKELGRDGDVKEKSGATEREPERGCEGDGKEKSSAGEEPKKRPPPESPEAVKLRTKVILSFWAVIVFLGLPVWWQTTSIYRARLPVQEMLDWSERTVCGYG